MKQPIEGFIKHSRPTQRGWALLDVIIALAVVAAMIPVIATYLSMSNDEMLKKAAAAYMEQVSNAATQYVENEYSTLQASTTATTAASVSITDLVTDGLLPSTFGTENPWGQTTTIWVTQPTSGNLEALLLTYGGRTYDASQPQFGDILVPAAAALIGPSGGYVPTGHIPGQSTTTIQGAFGAWKFPLSGTNVTASTPGHLAALLYFDQGQLASDYLYRVAVSGHPELNTMYTTLNMNGNTIDMGNGDVGGGSGQGIARLNFESHTAADFSCDTTEANSGGVFFDPDQGLYVCRDGAKMLIHDQGNTGMFETASISAPGDTITKPVCAASTGLSPRIMLAPSLYSSGATGDAIGAVQTWATDNGTTWTINMRILTSSGWVVPPSGYGEIMVLTDCGT